MPLSGGKLSEKGLAQYFLNKYLTGLGLKPDSRPTVSQLISVAKTRLGLLLPPFLVNYSTSFYQAPSLNKIRWARLNDSLVPPQMLEKEIDAGSTNEKKEEIFFKGTKGDGFKNNQPKVDQLSKLRELNKILSRRSYKFVPAVSTVTQKIEIFLKNKNELCPFLEALAEWSLVMLRTKKLTYKKASITSMQSYLYAIGKPLIVSGYDLNIRKLTLEDWESLYGQVLDFAVSPRSRTNQRKHLLRFHKFLIMKYGVPKVNIKDVAGLSSTADANILTPKEYNLCKKMIINDPTTPTRLKKIQLLMLTLGYRCSLRRTEVNTLTLADVQDGQGILHVREIPLSKPELLKQNNKFAKTKSNKSVRRLPLSNFLTNEELSSLIEWKGHRLTECGSGGSQNALLFCDENEELIKNQNKTFGKIEMIMREVTKDPTISFHNLRHSFPNFLLLLVLDELYPGILPSHWYMDGEESLLPQQPGHNLGELLFLSPHFSFSRRILYLVAQFCGHVDPQETIRTYLHLFDWILGYYLKLRDQELSIDEQAVLLGITSNSWRVERSKKKIKGKIFAKDFIGIFLKRFGNPAPNSLKDTLVPLSQGTNMMPLKGKFEEQNPFVMHRIFENLYEGVNIDELAEAYELEKIVVEKWLKYALQFAKITTVMGRSRLIKSLDAKRIDEIKELTAEEVLSKKIKFWPALPPTSDGKNDAQEIFERFIKMYKEDPALAKKGFTLYSSRATRTETDIRLKSDEERIFYVNFFKELFGGEKRIKVSLHPHPATPENEQIAYWAGLLALPLENIKAVEYDNSPPPKEKTGRIVVLVGPVDGSYPKRRSDTPFSWPAVELRFGVFMATVSLSVDSGVDQW